LTEPSKAHEKFFYNDREKVETTILEFISTGFNSRKIDYDIFFSPNDGKLYASLKPFAQYFIGSDVLFLPVTGAKRAGITCASTHARISFYDYHAIYGILMDGHPSHLPHHFSPILGCSQFSKS